MQKPTIFFATTICFLTLNITLHSDNHSKAEMLGQFNLKKDLLLAQFDSKTDVDDIHAIAGVATMLADPRFKDVNYHAVAGAYGNQTGLYVPANELFQLAFGNKWSDAHANFEKALAEVTLLAGATLKAGGTIWIAEAGQSNFSAFLLRRLKKELPDIDYQKHFNVVQHSKWNEKQTDGKDLSYVKEHGGYHKIPDGNAGRNGTPQLRDEKVIEWRNHVKAKRLIKIWEMAIDIANKFNGLNRRYMNKSIQRGGLDFSDVSEMTWIFGFAGLKDADEFFKTFSSQSATMRQASGLLEHFPSNVRSAAAWEGIEFKVGGESIIASATVTREKLMSLVGQHVTIKGTWHEGKIFKPDPAIQTPYPTDMVGRTRGAGIKAMTIRKLENQGKHSN